MGSGGSCEYSREEYDSYALKLYEIASEDSSLLPDVGLDGSLLKYSGLKSNAELRSYSDGLVKQVPDLVKKLGSILGSYTGFTNAVGLGALMIAMIIDIGMKNLSATSDGFLKAFGEEKASGVRDTVSEYVKRHQMYLTDNRHLQGELERLERQLSNHLTILRNSLLLDGQMRSRGLKIWVNGASFHVQMLIHEARLNRKTGISSKDYVHVIQRALTTYLQDLDQLLEKHRAQLVKNTYFYYCPKCCGTACCGQWLPCITRVMSYRKDPCAYGRKLYVSDRPGLLDSYMNQVFSKFKPLSGLKSHFSDIKTNLKHHIDQHESFTLPSA
uniref:uncharacterized protein LOC120835666 n=1 Tax=Gasterosteus aculeatus aculeatus TaxID=481459 RepID=UPI001A99B056|nr:uncharacterized protein LOC120835666 [Gasterosteus aculeatus aculeatus]